MKSFVTDLAVELLRRIPRHSGGITVNTMQFGGAKITATQITNAAGAEQIGKPVGTYINIECAADSDISAVLTRELKKIICPLPLGFLRKDPTSRGKENGLAVKSPNAAGRAAGAAGARILAVGLGNDRFVADSLGPLALSYIRTGEKMMTFEPNVKGITGINSVDAIKQIVALCRPDFVIAVDGLVSASADRIGCNYQIATTGITPGSGICRDNKRLDKEFLRVPVIAVGVPVCTVIEDGKGNTLHATVKEIDRMVLLAAQNIAGGINGLG
jgi:spore protease